MSTPIRTATRYVALYSKLFKQAVQSGDFDLAREYAEGLRFWERQLKYLVELYKNLEQAKRLLKQAK